jgi:hypothetical protein
VQFDIRDRKLLRQRKAVALALKEYDPDFVHAEYWDRDVQWIATVEDDGILDDITAGKVLTDVEFPRGERMEAELSCIVVDERGVYWTCTVKHTVVNLETECLEWPLLERKK